MGESWKFIFLSNRIPFVPMWVKHEIVELIRCCCTDTSQLITITELAGDEEKIPTVPHSHSPVHCDFVQDVSHCMANFVIFGYFLFYENKKSYEHESNVVYVALSALNGPKLSSV